MHMYSAEVVLLFCHLKHINFCFGHGMCKHFLYTFTCLVKLAQKVILGTNGQDILQILHPRI